MGNEQFTSWLYFHKIVSLSCMCVFCFVLFLFFHSFIGYSSCNIQYTFIIQHTQKKEKKQKPKRGRCNGTNVLCEAPPLDQDQAQASTRLGLKLKKFLDLQLATYWRDIVTRCTLLVASLYCEKHIWGWLKVFKIVIWCLVTWDKE